MQHASFIILSVQMLRDDAVHKEHGRLSAFSRAVGAGIYTVYRAKRDQQL